MSEICTWLYTPASSGGKLDKALHRGADAVIFDLEDAVHVDRKTSARAELVEFLSSVSVLPASESPDSSAAISRIFVRANALDSPWGIDDLNAIAKLPAVEGIRVPKVESLTDLSRIESVVSARKKIQILLESPLGLAALEDLCRAGGPSSVSLGDNDLRAVLNVEGEAVLDQIRIRLVMALAAAGKEAPTGSVYPRIKDLEGLRSDSVRLRGMGFFGRTVLHPMQLETVRDAFRPDSQEVDWAHSVVEAADRISAQGSGAVMLSDGQFVDRPFVVRAETILRRAGVDRRQL
ncbi:HpcH/HpaI aldolase/citrate lyase family protein [Brevibacterium sp. UCMA 11754]|uniref:HpcH/HpaI aldolase/citrate lyase family protein n=1 Tax=Brevibacterium sp. UCMA 11754 TaxID=2749198 RepID=UPI001F2E93E7|nr:CoA ester lyase [Brevibacterium sp. UCMA 11754]MCF2573987.1 CoA ester lyase [Brevibacterium sp. UCMA 11754]